MLGIYGRGLSRNYVHNLATISEIEALPETRLYNAYFEQGFYNDALNIRVGQQAADVEFFDSQTDDLFINGTFGWPANKANNLPSGGPAPPIAVPGIRVKATLSDQITVFGAVFNGNAARPGDGDPQLRDNHGLAFRVNDPPWLIGQVRWSYDLDFGTARSPAISRRAAGIIPEGSTISASPHKASRSPIPAAPASPPGFAAISESSPSSSRRCTGRPR